MLSLTSAHLKCNFPMTPLVRLLDSRTVMVKMTSEGERGWLRRRWLGKVKVVAGKGGGEVRWHQKVEVMVAGEVKADR